MASESAGAHTQEGIQAVNSESAEAINEYLALQDDSESPRTFLIWSLIAGAAALIGKNASLYAGENLTVVPNLFVVLLGPSGVRKSSAINMMASMLKSTSLYYGPTDTGNQRHGLMSALAGLHRNDGWLLRRRFQNGPLIRSMLHPREVGDMCLFEPELGRLLGSGSLDMANFFVDIYDGASIDYQTRASETWINNPRVTMLTATTPANLAEILPASAADHGITARMLFIYADKRHKSVPLPANPTEEWWDAKRAFTQRLHWIDNNRIDFIIGPEARLAYSNLYEYIALTTDPRLSSYRERRSSTLLKVAMCLAALRMDNQIIESDVLLAHELLITAEPLMYKALEYFGRNKKHQGRMLMIQFLQAKGAMKGASITELTAAASPELNQRDAQDAIQSMVASGELAKIADKYFLGTLKNELLKGKAKPSNPQ